MSYGKISAKQREILEYIKDSILNHGYPPAVREICDAVNLRSTSSVHSHLETLEKNGYIRRDPTKPRAIEIVDDNFNLARRELVNVPIVGTVTAGEPILAVQNLEGTVTVDRDFLACRSDVFALRVRGDSMIDAGIFDGDLVFARQQKSAERGEIIVAQIDNEATVKYYQPSSDHIELRPANPKYRPIIVKSNKDFSIAGRVIGVMRKVN